MMGEFPLTSGLSPGGPREHTRPKTRVTVLTDARHGESVEKAWGSARACGAQPPSTPEPHVKDNVKSGQRGGRPTTATSGFRRPDLGFDRATHGAPKTLLTRGCCKRQPLISAVVRLVAQARILHF